MPTSAVPVPSESLRGAWGLGALGLLAAPLAALLGFSIQLLLAKHLLPIYGGAPAVWLGASLYFQLTLVLGYGWAVWLLGQRALVQAGATAALALLALGTFHLPGNAAESASLWVVMGRLALCSLPAMILIFATSPLLHGWLAAAGREPPYFLYAWSNAGSLLGLLGYPFLIEPRLGVAAQSELWHALLGVLAATLAVLAGLAWRAEMRRVVLHPAAVEGAGEVADMVGVPGKGEGAASMGDAASAEAGWAARVPWDTRAALGWVVLSALAVVQLLGATHLIAGELGGQPLAWVGPLGCYLLGFAWVFAGGCRAGWREAGVAVFAVALGGYMAARGWSAATIEGARLGWLLLLSACASTTAAHLLYQRRPSLQPERFYLAMGVGGGLGGVLSAWVIPGCFPVPVEFVLSALVLFWLALLDTLALASWRRQGLLLVVLAAPVLALGLQQLQPLGEAGQRVLHLRDTFGAIQLTLRKDIRVLSSETTTHGSQVIVSEQSRRQPTLYYTESSAVGRVWQQLQATRPTMQVGVIGLGAGTLATYTRVGDRLDFWDIDPKSISVAARYFTYVADAAGQVEIGQRDGRKALENTTADYDLLVVDAFNGDSVPAHLFTREAFMLYQRRLAARSGLLVLHTSSRYNKVFPVVQQTAASVGWVAIRVFTEISQATANRDFDPTVTEYIVLSPPGSRQEVLGWLPLSEDQGRVTRIVDYEGPAVWAPELIWTDDRQAGLDTLDWRRVIWGE